MFYFITYNFIFIDTYSYLARVFFYFAIDYPFMYACLYLARVFFYFAFIYAFAYDHHFFFSCIPVYVYFFMSSSLIHLVRVYFVFVKFSMSTISNQEFHH